MQNTKIYTSNKKSFEDIYGANYYNPSTPRCSVYENVLLEPLKNIGIPGGIYFSGGVCYEDGTHIAGFYRGSKTDKSNRNIFESYKPDTDNIEHLSGEYIYGGTIIFAAFGHVLTDYLARLWYIAKHPENKSKIFFFCENNNFPTPTIEKLFWNIMDLLGIERERVFIVDRIFKADKVYVPDQSFSFYGMHTDEIPTVYNALIDSALSRGEAGKVYSKKVYLTRSKLPKQDIINEEYFEEMYKKQGYEIVSPETLSFEEQIRVMANAEEVVTTTGSIHFLTFFSRNLKKCTFLLKESISEVFLHKGNHLIYTLKKADLYIVDVSMNFLACTNTNGVSLVGPTCYWKQYLDDNKVPYTDDDLIMDWNKVPEFLARYLDIYTSEGFAFNYVKNQDYFDLLNRLSMISGKDALDRKMLGIRSKPDYDKEIKNLNDQIKKLKSNDQKLLEIQNEFDLAKKDSEEKLLAARNELELEQKANEEKLLAVKNELELERKANEEKLLAVKSDLELAKQQAEYERYAVHIPESLKIITPDKKKVKALYLNCGEHLIVNDVECNIDDILQKLTKKYSYLNKQWKSLLGIAYAYMFERKYDMIFKTLENDSISLSDADISRLGKSSVDVVFDDVIRLDDAVEKHCTDEFGSKIFELVMKALEKIHPEHSAQAKEIFNENTVYSCSAFIMKKNCFDEYAEWVLPVLNEISSNITSKEMQLLPRMADMLLTAYFRMNSDRYIIGTLN